jgi:hypothetical protein
MKAEFVTRRCWEEYEVRVGARKVLCSDGVRRYARLTSEPKTYFSIPASVKVRGKTVSGFVWLADGEDIHFTAYESGKNGHLLPMWHEAEG